MWKKWNCTNSAYAAYSIYKRNPNRTQKNVQIQANLLGKAYNDNHPLAILDSGYCYFDGKIIKHITNGETLTYSIKTQKIDFSTDLDFCAALLVVMQSKEPEFNTLKKDLRYEVLIKNLYQLNYDPVIKGNVAQKDFIPLLVLLDLAQNLDKSHLLYKEIKKYTYTLFKECIPKNSLWLKARLGEDYDNFIFEYYLTTANLS